MLTGMQVLFYAGVLALLKPQVRAIALVGLVILALVDGCDIFIPDTWV